MRRVYGAVGLIVAVIFAGAAYQLLFGADTVAPRLVSSTPVALIGADSGEAVAVAGDGTVLTWFAVPEESDLPHLPLETPPEGPRLQGPALEQVRVLAATPAALRPYVAGSYYGESGVDVNLTSGVELRFGDSTQAARKWRAAAAVLADPSVTTLDYVNLYAPSRPTVGGSGHTLPSIP